MICWKNNMGLYYGFQTPKAKPTLLLVSQIVFEDRRLLAVTVVRWKRRVKLASRLYTVSKTFKIIYGSRGGFKPVFLIRINLKSLKKTLASQVRNLGVIFDPQLRFESHIKHISKTAFYHLRNAARLEPFLSFADSESLIHAFIIARLDYCNALFSGIPAKFLSRLQYTQHSAIFLNLSLSKSIALLVTNYFLNPINLSQLNNTSWTKW